MIRRTGIDVALVAIALMLGACTYSINPLSAPGDSEPDARLEGVWQVTSGDPSGIGYAYVVPTDNGLMDVDLVDYQYKKDLGDSSPVKWDRLRVFRTEIDGAQYLNVMPVAKEWDGERKKWEGPVYFIYKYDISQDGVLTIWGPSLSTLHRDIKEGRLAGITDSTSENSTSTSELISALIPNLSVWIVTGSAEELRDYLRQGNDPFTKHRWTLRKILPKVPGQ